MSEDPIVKGWRTTNKREQSNKNATTLAIKNDDKAETGKTDKKVRLMSNFRDRFEKALFVC